eukprot:5589690-Pleurochrysis_carterae.AAC.2
MNVPAFFAFACLPQCQLKDEPKGKKPRSYRKPDLMKAVLHRQPNKKVVSNKKSWCVTLFQNHTCGSHAATNITADESQADLTLGLTAATQASPSSSQQQSQHVQAVDASAASDVIASALPPTSQFIWSRNNLAKEAAKHVIGNTFTHAELAQLALADFKNPTMNIVHLQNTLEPTTSPLKQSTLRAVLSMLQ